MRFAVRKRQRALLPPSRSYPYGGKVFSGFVATSLKVHGGGPARDFYRWMDKSFANYKGDPQLTWAKWATEKHSELASVNSDDPNAVADEEQKIGKELHWDIKKTIPKFSLDRGFEFYYTITLGVRQCFLQSIVVAGLLQRIGINAGVAMVWKNMNNEPSNNGHAVTLVTLRNGQQMLVDCSEPEPFATHRGLFAFDAAKNHYMFFEPTYNELGRIPEFHAAGSGALVSDNDVKTLDIPFLKSQFDYYRGEREPKGIFDENPTRIGLQGSYRFLARAVKECPSNPLAVYQFGRTAEKLGQVTLAKKEIYAARHLYAMQGWTPSGEKDALATVRGAGAR